MVFSLGLGCLVNLSFISENLNVSLYHNVPKEPVSSWNTKNGSIVARPGIRGIE